MQKIISTSPAKTLPYAGAALAGLVLANAAWADSAKLMWDGNGHYYQRFDEDNITWLAAKTNCETAGGHLMTITSADEQGFINANLLTGYTNFYHIGGIRVDS